MSGAESRAASRVSAAEGPVTYHEATIAADADAAGGGGEIPRQAGSPVQTSIESAPPTVLAPASPNLGVRERTRAAGGLRAVRGAVLRRAGVRRVGRLRPGQAGRHALPEPARRLPLRNPRRADDCGFPGLHGLRLLRRRPARHRGDEGRSGAAHRLAADAGRRAAMFAALATTRMLHELLWYLRAALDLPATAPLHHACGPPTTRPTRSPRAPRTTSAGSTRRPTATTSTSCCCRRASWRGPASGAKTPAGRGGAAGRGTCGAVLLGADLRGADLRGEPARGAARRRRPARRAAGAGGPYWRRPAGRPRRPVRAPRRPVRHTRPAGRGAVHLTSR